MNIVHIVPGTGGSFYCENCVRDGGLVKALHQAGYHITMVPLYLPLVIDEPSLAGDAPVFFGAVSTFLKEKFPPLRRMPGWLEKPLNSPAMLKYAASKAGSTRAAGLEDMTLSMLSGEQGNQAAELEHLVQWLKETIKPDVVYLANALLLGLVHRIREQLNVPVVCALEDEDIWLASMDPVQLDRIRAVLKQKAQEVDAFITVSDTFRERIQKFLDLPASQFTTVHVGIDLEGYEESRQEPEVPTVGYLSRMCAEMGLDILVDAFIQIRTSGALDRLRLLVTGGMTGDDQHFLSTQRQKLDRAGLIEDVTFVDDFDRSGRINTLKSMTIMSVPLKKEEAFGVFQIEAMAAGVPIVQPAMGACPEIINLTGGGIVYQPNTAEKLARALVELLKDDSRRHELSKQGRKMVHEKFSNVEMSRRLMAIYEKVIADRI